MYYFEIRKRQSHLYWPLRKENHILRIIMSSNHNILIHMSFTSSRASLVAQLVRISLKCGRPGFDPWVGKIPWRRERLPTPVFWPGEFRGLYSPWGCKESDATELLSLHSLTSLSGSTVKNLPGGYT